MIIPNGDYPTAEEKLKWTDKYTEEVINKAIL